MPRILPHLAVSAFAVAVGLFGSTLVSCSSTGLQKGLSTGGKALDIGDTICDAIESELPDKLRVLCRYIDAADKTSHVFLATVPKADAAKFGVRAPCSPAPAASAAPSSSK